MISNKEIELHLKMLDLKAYGCFLTKTDIKEFGKRLKESQERLNSSKNERRNGDVKSKTKKRNKKPW